MALLRCVRRVQLQMDEQLGKRACALTPRGSISKAMKGLVGGARAGLCGLPQELDHSPHSAEFGQWNSSHQCAEAARIAWGGGRYKLARSAMREQGRSKTGIASLPHVKLSPMSAPGPTGERQEHLDATVSFAGAGQRRRWFWELDILTIEWATGDLPEECRFLFDTQLMFLKKEKDPTTKQFDDDEWIRSLTEAQEVTTDIPEESVTSDQQDVDPKKVRPIQMGEFLRKYVSRRLLALSEGEIGALTTSMRQIGVGTRGGAEAFGHLSSTPAR